MSSLHSLFTQLLWAHVSSVLFLRHSFGRMQLAFAELVYEVFRGKERAKKILCTLLLQNLKTVHSASEASTNQFSLSFPSLDDIGNTTRPEGGEIT